jgi:hypothetical protein
VRVTLRLAVYRQSVSLGAKPLEAYYQWFFQLDLCGHSPYVTSSLRRGSVCRLQLLLALASAVILGCESRGTHDQILLFQLRYSSNLAARSPYLYHPGTGWSSYTPKHWVHFSSPPTPRRAMVVIFVPASTRALIPSAWDPRYIASGRTHRERRLQHLFYCCVTSPRTSLPNRSTATVVRVKYHDTSSIVACGHYLATAGSLPPQFLLWANTPPYLIHHHLYTSSRIAWWPPV